MLSEKWKTILERSVLIAIGVLLLGLYIANASQKESAEVAPGIPLVYSNQNEIARKSIDQIVDDGERIYLLLNDHEGIVQIYDATGIYLNSVAFFNHINGAFRIAVADGVFYVCDKQGNLYLFPNGTFSEFIDNQTGAELRREINFEQSSTKYILHKGSVWSVTGDDKVCVISRPMTSVFFQGHYMFFLCFGVIFLGGIFYAIKKKQ